MKERNQNPIVTDDLKLRIATFNSNAQKNVNAIQKVEIYRLDPSECSEENPDGRVLVDTITSITTESTGSYSVTLSLDAGTYSIGKYIDVWFVVFKEDETPAHYTQYFEIYPDLWYVSPTPAVYGFSFEFQPNRIRKGSIKWIVIKVTPNVPRATELERYYTNLAILSNLKISIEQVCGPCVPKECDLRLILEDELIEMRDKVFGYYKLDTTEDGLNLDCGIYNIWFTLEYADSIEISDKMQFQIY